MSTVTIGLAGLTYELSGDLTRHDAADLETMPERVIAPWQVITDADAKGKWSVALVNMWHRCTGDDQLTVLDGLTKGKAEQLAAALAEIAREQHEAFIVEVD